MRTHSTPAGASETTTGKTALRIPMVTIPKEPAPVTMPPAIYQGQSL